ncbi:MAG: hypothetical protein QOI91_2831, partial [Solirubrobacteraceae bacterium]|nr:hypothetical protein [Solirubrobacteraceae bacterium]
MEEVIPGVLHWQARHPNLGVDVSSHLLTDTGTALDPILPEGEGAGWIGHDVQRAVLTCRHHVRSAPGLGVPIFAHRAGLSDLEGIDAEVHGYDAGDELAPGVRVLAFGRISPDDAVLHIAAGPGGRQADAARVRAVAAPGRALALARRLLGEHRDGDRQVQRGGDD